MTGRSGTQLSRSVVSRRALLTGLAGAVALPLVSATAACSAAFTTTGARTELAMSSGEAGGRYIQFGELLADALSPRGIDLNVITTHGSADNALLLAEGVVDLAITLSDTAEHRASSAVALGRVYQNYLQCLVPADGPVRALHDLAGRPISLGAEGSGSALTSERLLDVNGLTGASGPLRSEHQLAEALDMLGSGSLDAVFWSSGIPTPLVEELDARVPLRVVDLSSALPALETAYPELYVATSVPPGVYSTATPTPTVGIPNLLLASPELPDDVARALVDTLIEDAASLVPPGSVGLQFLTPANLIDTGTIPLHPAASARYRERYG